MNSSQSEGDGQQTTYPRLIEEKNLAFREVEPGGSPVETFLKVWPRLEPHYGTMVEQLKSALEGALSVRCTVSARVKSLTSITKSIERRQIHRGKHYKEVDEIFDDLHDLAGFRIIVDYPSGIQIAKSFITQNFQLKSSNVFKADREVSDTWKPTFGSFQSENHHVLLHPDAKYPISPFCGILFEIQILSLAESLYNRLAHPLLYKKSSGQLSIKEEKMIDVTHGLSLCYWICLSCMEDRLEGKQTQEIPISVQTVAQTDGDQNADMESFVKATPGLVPASGEIIPIERCLESVKDLSKEAMSADQLHARLSALLNGPTRTTTTNANYGSGHIVQNYGSGSNTHSNTTYNSGGGNITFAKDDIEDEIRNAFWVTHPQSHKDDIQERKGGLIEGSYRWILQDEHFKKWYEQEYSLLWLNGDPGKGKTMSVCGIIDHISALSDSDTIISYFFCDASDSKLNNGTSVLRGIVYSIIFQNRTALFYVQSQFKELSKPLSDPRLAWPVLRKLFVGIFSAIKDQKTYLIIDALDECKEGRDKLLELIINQSSLLPIKWLVSSRKWPLIKEIITTCPKLLELNLEVNEKDVSAAVDFYISHQVESLSIIKQYDLKRKEAVELHLRSNSKNTFLWVSLVCKMLKQIPAWQTMRKLDKLPAGLDALYGRMLGDLGSDELYLRNIAFTLGVFRPLSLDELYYLIDDEEIDIKDLEDIVAHCGSFLTIQHQVVHFIHDSAKDYLLKTNDFRFNPQQQHAVLFSRSLSNLTRSLQRDILHSESRDPRTVQEGLGSISYQSIHWVSHLAESEPSIVTQELLDGSLVDGFLRQKFLFWLEALGHLKCIGLGISEMLKLERMVDNHASELKSLVQDEVRFIRYHQSGIEQFPLQVYPLLNFTPHNSMTREAYKSEAPTWFTVKQGVHDHWSPCILTLEGHIDAVYFVAFSHDGRLLASGSHDGTVRIWDVLTGACLHTLLGHEDCVCVLAFSPKNYNLATGSDDNTIKVWDASKYVLIRTRHCQNRPVYALTFSKNGNLMASSAHDGTIRLLDTTTGVCTRELIINDDRSIARSITFTHNDQILSCGTRDSVLIWDLKNQTEPHRIQMENADFSYESVISSQTNELFFIRDNDVEVWDPATKMRIRSIRYPAFSIYGPTIGRSVILSRHGTLLGVVGGDEVQILNPSTLKWTVQIREWSNSSSVSPTCDILALASGPKISIWDISTITPLSYSSPAADYMPVFSSDGSLVATGSETEAKLIIWRSCTRDSIAFAKPWPIGHKPIFSFDGQILILPYSKEIDITHISKEGVDFTVSFPQSHHGVVAFSHDNRWLAVPFLDHVSIFDFGTQFAEIKIGLNKKRWEFSELLLTFSHDSRILAIHDGKYINLYDINTWRCNSALCHVEREGLRSRNVLFSSDDKFLATTSHDTSRGETEVNVWNLEKKDCMRMLYAKGCFNPFKLEVSTFLQLETDLGTFQIIDGRIQPLVSLKYAISKDLQWILKGSERLIWLPPDYRPTEPSLTPYAEFRFCRTCSKFKAALITDNSRLVILTLP